MQVQPLQHRELSHNLPHCYTRVKPARCPDIVSENQRNPMEASWLQTDSEDRYEQSAVRSGSAQDRKSEVLPVSENAASADRCAEHCLGDGTVREGKT